LGSGERASADVRAADARGNRDVGGGDADWIAQVCWPVSRPGR